MLIGTTSSLSNPKTINCKEIERKKGRLRVHNLFRKRWSTSIRSAMKLQFTHLPIHNLHPSHFERHSNFVLLHHHWLGDDSVLSSDI